MDHVVCMGRACRAIAEGGGLPERWDDSGWPLGDLDADGRGSGGGGGVEEADRQEAEEREERGGGAPEGHPVPRLYFNEFFFYIWCFFFSFLGFFLVYGK